MSTTPSPNKDKDLSSDGVIQLSKKARRLFCRREYGLAQDLYRQGLATDPHNPYLLSGMGDACREAGNLDEAETTYQTLLALEPENLFALRGMGDTCKGKGLVADAIPYWERYLILRPDDVHVMTRLAESFKSLDRNTPAENLYRQILLIDSMDSFALTGLADLLHRSGRDYEAIECYEKILTLRQDVLHILTIVGKLCWRVSDYDKSKTFFLRALEIDPRNPYALYGLGNCYRWQREYSQAVEVWQRILEHSEGSASLYSRLGDAYTHLGDLASAEQAYRQVLDQAYDRCAKIGMVKLLCDQGKLDSALIEINELLSHERDPWQQIDDLSRRFVSAGRRVQMVEFYNYMIQESIPDCLDADRFKQLVKKLEP